MSPPPYGQTSTPQPPWHMWGGSVYWNIAANQIVPVGGGVGLSVSQQACKINYRRPDTWAFWFSGNLLEVSPQPFDMQLSLCFDVIIGVGRSSFDTYTRPDNHGDPSKSPFCRIDWSVPSGIFAAGLYKRYTTQVRGTPLQSQDPGHPDEFGMLIDRLVAQDIQVLATLSMSTTAVAADTRIAVEGQAYFAPLSHIRPDWFAGGAFLGGETGGT